MDQVPTPRYGASSDTVLWRDETETVFEWGHIPSSGGFLGCLRVREIPPTRHMLDSYICKNVKHGILFILKMQYNKKFERVYKSKRESNSSVDHPVLSDCVLPLERWGIRLP